MGTHNRLLNISAPGFPRAYFEIIAINPQAKPPGRRRWFDLDDAALQEAVIHQPRLIHFVARTEDAAVAAQALQRLAIERGPLVKAERPTPDGMLQWQISVREDGQRLFYGGLPTLIEWGSAHPADTMPSSGLALQSLHVSHPRVEDLQAAHRAIGLAGVTTVQGPPNLVARLNTPKGHVTLESGGA